MTKTKPKRARRVVPFTVAGVAAASLTTIALAGPSTAATATNPSPVNDDFANAIALSGATPSVTGSSLGATSQTGETMPEGYQAARTVWYAWNPSKDEQVRVSVSPSGATPLGNPDLAVYTEGDENHLITRGFNEDYIGSSDNGSEVDIVAKAGATYYIQVGGESTSFQGTFDLAVSSIGTGVSGTVTDPSGKPIAGACVSLNGTAWTGQASVTDAAGRYAFQVPAGAGQQISASNCLGDTNIVPTDATTVDVSQGSVTSGADITAQPGTTISGTITNQNGDAVATCVDVSSPVDDLLGIPSSTYTGYSDHLGRFTVAGLPAGEYDVQTRDCGWSMLDGVAAPTLVTTTSGNADDVSLAVTQDGGLRGMVTGWQDNMPDGVVATLSGAEGTSFGPLVAMVPMSGDWSQTVPAGSYTLTYSDYSDPTKKVGFTSTITVGVGQEVDGLDADFSDPSDQPAPVPEAKPMYPLPPAPIFDPTPDPTPDPAPPTSGPSPAPGGSKSASCPTEQSAIVKAEQALADAKARVHHDRVVLRRWKHRAAVRHYRGHRHAAKRVHKAKRHLKHDRLRRNAVRSALREAEAAEAC